MKGQYQLQLPNGTVIPMRFCAWTFTRFSVISGDLTYSDVLKIFDFDLIYEDPSAEKPVVKELAFKRLTLTHLQNILLCAAEYECRKANKGFHYNDLDAADWIDAMGGIYGAKTMDVLCNYIITALAPQGDSESQPAEATEKNAEASA